MIIFLLLMILAVLLFGAGIFLKAGAAVFKAAVAVLVVAVFFGMVAAVPQVAWNWFWALAGVLALLVAVAGVKIVAQADSDTKALASEDGRRLRKLGLTAQQTVEYLAAGLPIDTEPDTDAINEIPAREVWTDLSFRAKIDYVDADGVCTTRRIKVHTVKAANGLIDRVEAFCSLRRADRTFMLSGIQAIKDLDDDLHWNDPIEWLRYRSAQAASAK